jgi:uncharacterized membrane protein
MTANESMSFMVIMAILAMSGATYAMRAGGFWLMGYVRMTPRIRRMLEASPGAVIVATVLPIVVREGLPATFAVLVGVGIMLLWRRDYVAVAFGLAVAAGLRALMP